MYAPEPHHHTTIMSPRRRPDEQDDMSEDQLSYLPGSGPGEYGGLEYPPPPGFVTAFWNPYEVKHRRRTSRAQLGVLETEFETDPKPNADKRRSLAAQLNMTPRAIQVWFQNRRAKIKAIKNKIPGGRGMPKLKPAERAAARASRASGSDPVSPSDDKEENEWVQLSPEESPMSSPDEPAFVSEKPQFTISAPDEPSRPSSPVMVAPPLAAAMLRRGSAPAPLQGIHRARYSVFNRSNELEVTMPPASPISPLDHQVAPMCRPSMGLNRRPSLPDSHLRLPAHPYYQASAPRMQRRGGLLSPVPDVSQEQEQAQYPPLPTMLPPAPAVGSSRMYRALPPGMGAVPAAHDLPTQLPARPSTTWTPQRPFAVPVAGPLPAADFSFGAPEPGHGDAFNRVMDRDREDASDDYHEFNPSQEYNEFAPHMWDARTRFGSMASIASDVTGVSVSSTQATSVSGGLGTATFSNTDFECPQPSYGFQPDLRRASCPGEFLHQFSGMGVTTASSTTEGPASAPVRPSPLGRSLTMAPDARMMHDAKSLRSPTFAPGQVDPTFPPPPPEQGDQVQVQGQMRSPHQPSTHSPTLSPCQGAGFGNGYEQQGYARDGACGYGHAPEGQSGYVDGYASDPNGYSEGQSGYPSEGQNGYPLEPRNGYTSEGQNGYASEPRSGYASEGANGYNSEAQNGYTSEPQNGYAPDGYTPDAQTAYHNDQTRYPTDTRPYIHTPSPTMGGVPVLGPATNMEIINLNKEQPRMLFAERYDMLVHQEYTHPTEYVAYS
ncbi:homeobox domain protein [Rhizoctonia solani AG-3 Rhs1AP]|uniref:Homeobox domain protein n=1 Tax=Rhizoctonia solani AG-3 Rhs1AP TaxID=1086054 RepID=A0A0A1UI72_9AGAM|nr:homeobox domain protein [Rhizoctonia solani AG-3 Rhs1AP]